MEFKNTVSFKTWILYATTKRVDIDREEDVGLSLKALLLQKAEEKENLEKDSDAGGSYGGWFWKYVKECWLMCQMLLFGQVG